MCEFRRSNSVNRKTVPRSAYSLDRNTAANNLVNRVILVFNRENGRTDLCFVRISLFNRGGVKKEQIMAERLEKVR